jgi:CDP-paratose 2-epimerase
MPAISGQAFNIGGGAKRAISLLALLDMIGELHGEQPHCEFSDWRAGDQRYYVTDTRKFEAATGWQAKVSPEEGVRRLYDWLRQARGLDQSRPKNGGNRSGAIRRRGVVQDGYAMRGGEERVVGKVPQSL